MDFPVCEGACIYWKRRSTITPPVCNPDKQEAIKIIKDMADKKREESFTIKLETTRGKVKETRHLTKEEFADIMNNYISKMGVEKKEQPKPRDNGHITPSGNSHVKEFTPNPTTKLDDKKQCLSVKDPHKECKFYTEGTGRCSHPDKKRFVVTCFHQCGYFIKVIKK